MALVAGAAITVAGTWWATQWVALVDAQIPIYREVLDTQLARFLLHALRLVLMLVPALAFCWAARAWSSESNRSGGMVSLVMCLVLAVVPTYLYTRTRVAALREEALTYLQQERAWRAWQHSTAARAVDKSLDPRLQVDLDRLIARHLAAVRHWTATGNPVDEIKALPHLMALDEHEQVRELIAKPSVNSEIAKRVRIELARREENWTGVVALLEPREQSDFDLLAAAYRGQGDWEKAETLYLSLIDGRQDQQRHWKLQLAKHYERSGRPGKALALYDEVFKTRQGYDAAAGESAEASIRLRRNTPTCFLPGF
jgi:tetratricopeptide (TPR) repeat protein